MPSTAFSLTRRRFAGRKWLSIVLAAIFGLSEFFSQSPRAEENKPAPAAVVTRLRFFPAPGREKAMVGGRIAGSNTSARAGFEPIAEIKETPAPGQWTEFSFANSKLYRWIRYEAPDGSYGNVAELEFYAGSKRLLGNTFGSFGWRGNRNWPRAFDKDTATWFDSDTANGQYLGIDLGEAATAQMPRFAPQPSPTGAEEKAPFSLALRCNTPGAIVRYSFEAPPGPGEGQVYQSPLTLERLTTVFAVAYDEGFPPSPAAWATYPVGAPLKPGFHSMHIGNSLTGSTLHFADYARAAGYKHDFHTWLKEGGATPGIWENTMAKAKDAWEKELAALPALDLLSVQPRLPGFTEEDLAREAKYDALFFAAARAKSPTVQPWIYAEWPSRRPGFNGWAPPCPTYQEACASLLLATEKIRAQAAQLSPEGKRPRIIPCTLAVAHLMNRLNEGRIPGLSASDFDLIMFYDNVHPTDPGRYLLCMIWFAAFYGESPIGKIPPLACNLTAAQAAALQQLAWEVVKNYPDCGLYEEGKQPCGKPEFIVEGSTLRLRSSTPGAWFRYTLDGTAPSRTSGYVYCGPITITPGIKVKAIACESGWADSELATSP